MSIGVVIVAIAILRHNAFIKAEALERDILYACIGAKTVRDVLLISDLITERIPSARMESISVNDYFAVVKANIARGRTHETVTLRLYEINGVWKIRGTAFDYEALERF